MRKASISILKARLSQYVAAVKAGEEVIVTEHGRPVARLTGVDVEGGAEGRVAQLIREGRLRAPTGTAPPARGADVVLPVDEKGRSLRALLDERAQSR